MVNEILELIRDIVSSYENHDIVDMNTVVVGGVKVGEMDVQEAEKKTTREVWVQIVGDQDKDYFLLSILFVYPNGTKYWWEDRSTLQAQKKVVRDKDGKFIELLPKAFDELYKEAQKRIQEIEDKRAEQKDRFAHDPAVNHDYHLKAGNLVIDVVNSKSGEVKLTEPIDWGETAFNLKNLGDTTRVVTRDGKRILQVVDPNTHRWTDVPNSPSERVAHYNEKLCTIEFVRGQFKQIPFNTQRSERMNGVRRFRYIISEQNARKMFSRMFRFGAMGYVTLLYAGTNIKVELFVGNETYFEPIGSWVGHNREYLNQLRKNNQH